MEGFLHFKMRPWLRRLITRSLAIAPAILVISRSGEEGTFRLLILSQVILSLQLPFAVIPLVKFTSSRLRMQRFASPPWMAVCAWIVAGVIVALNGKLVSEQIMAWADTAGPNRSLVLGGSISAAVALASLLAYMTFHPDREPRSLTPVSADDVVNSAVELVRSIHKVGVAVEATAADSPMLAEAMALARSHQAELILMHIVEGVGGQWNGPDAGDQEFHHDEQYLRSLVGRLNLELTGSGAPPVRMALGYGSVPQQLVQLSKKENVDLLLVGGHGHRGLSDLLRGTTIDAVRHHLKIPILAIRGT